MVNNVIRHLTSRDAFYWLVYYIVDNTPLRRWISDKAYLIIQYRCLCRKRLNLKNPQSFNEKLQWLKIYDHNPEYSKMVDKYEAKKYVASIIGEEYIIPTLGVWNTVDEIDWDSLPEQFVLKCTHDSGGLVVCRDKSKLDKEMALKKIRKSLKTSFYYSSREWPYKNVKPRIIAEKYMEDRKSDFKEGLIDYKFFCFDGEPKYCQVIRGRFSNETIDFYDLEWNHLPFIGLDESAKNGTIDAVKPVGLENMIEICKKLSSGIPFSRVDLYEINAVEYFGEITLYPHGGMGAIRPEEWSNRLGELIDIKGINGRGTK